MMMVPLLTFLLFSVPHILVIDNSDSFTHNFLQNFRSCDVLPSSATLESIRDYNNSVKGIDGVVIGPGPGNPYNPKDRSNCMSFIRHFRERNIPVLGVCFGLQLLWIMDQADGKGDMTNGNRRRVVPMNEVKHGIIDDDCVRYHSLHCIEPDSDDLQDERGSYTVKRRFSDNTVNTVDFAGADGKTWAWGIQGHPESCGTVWGGEYLQEFEKWCENVKKGREGGRGEEGTTRARGNKLSGRIGTGGAIGSKIKSDLLGKRPTDYAEKVTIKSR